MSKDIRTSRETYYAKNSDEIKAKQLDYYYTNKDAINEKLRNSKTVCECGSSISMYHEKRHYETNKHKKYLAVSQTDPVRESVTTTDL